MIKKPHEIYEKRIKDGVIRRRIIHTSDPDDIMPSDSKTEASKNQLTREENTTQSEEDSCD